MEQVLPASFCRQCWLHANRTSFLWSLLSSASWHFWKCDWWLWSWVGSSFCRCDILGVNKNRVVVAGHSAEGFSFVSWWSSGGGAGITHLLEQLFSVQVFHWCVWARSGAEQGNTHSYCLALYIKSLLTPVLCHMASGVEMREFWCQSDSWSVVGNLLGFYGNL